MVKKLEGVKYGLDTLITHPENGLGYIVGIDTISKRLDLYIVRFFKLGKNDCNYTEQEINLMLVNEPHNGLNYKQLKKILAQDVERFEIDHTEGQGALKIVFKKQKLTIEQLLAEMRFVYTCDYNDPVSTQKLKLSYFTRGNTVVVLDFKSKTASMINLQNINCYLVSSISDHKQICAGIKFLEECYGK